MNLYDYCKDSICNDPKLVLGSHVEGPNNKICRAWTERLGLGHRTVVGHDVHNGRSKVNQVCPWTLSIELNVLVPPFTFLVIFLFSESSSSFWRMNPYII